MSDELARAAAELDVLHADEARRAAAVAQLLAAALRDRPEFSDVDVLTEHPDTVAFTHDDHPYFIPVQPAGITLHMF